MKFFEFLKNIKRKIIKPELITLKKYKAIFKTTDGEWHEYNNYNYVDPETITCTIPEYLMIRTKYMKDDNFNMYPLENVVCIKWEISDIIENVIKKREKIIFVEFSHTFYEEEDIKIWEDK